MQVLLESGFIGLCGGQEEFRGSCHSLRGFWSMVIYQTLVPSRIENSSQILLIRSVVRIWYRRWFLWGVHICRGTKLKASRSRSGRPKSALKVFGYWKSKDFISVRIELAKSNRSSHGKDVLIGWRSEMKPRRRIKSDAKFLIWNICWKIKYFVSIRIQLAWSGNPGRGKCFGRLSFVFLRLNWIFWNSVVGFGFELKHSIFEALHFRVFSNRNF